MTALLTRRAARSPSWWASFAARFARRYTRRALYVQIFDAPALPSLTFGQRWRLVVKLIGLAFFITPLLLFVSFFVLQIAWGGSAEGGKIENGRYFLENRGVYVEVSAATWHWMRWHEWIAIRVSPLIFLSSVGITTLLARLERKRPNCSVEELVAVEPQPESNAINLRRAGPPQSRSYWILVSLAALAMMVVIDTATGLVVAEFGSLVRLLNLQFITWLIAAVSLILAGLLWLRERSRIGILFRVLGNLSVLYWLGGPIAFLFLVFRSALQQDLFMGALIGALFLATVGGQFLMGVHLIWFVATTLAEQRPKQESD